MPAHGHTYVAVALDGAGWHPAAWRDVAARPTALFAAAYWADLVREAERGLLDFVNVEDSLGVQSSLGDADDGRVDQVRGRLDAALVAARVAPVTSRVGLVPSGRAAWNVVTSSDAFTGENFRRGDYLAYAQRYERAAEFVLAAHGLWDSWPPGAVHVDKVRGTFLGTPSAGTFAYQSSQFDIAGRFNVPRSPQGHPVVIQAGDSDAGREFAAATADAADGHPRPSPDLAGLDEFVDRVVPLLQERGSFRTEYTSTTLRGHLGLAPARTSHRPGQVISA